MVVVLTVSACSSSKSSKSGGTTAAGSGSSSAANGSPINIMQIDDVTSPNGLAYPSIAESAKSTVADINARGGVAGHPIKLSVCDAQGDPNQTQACARKAVSDGVVAVVGSFTINAARLMPILTDAKIPYIPSFAYDPTEFSSAVSYPVNSALTSSPGMGVLAGKNCSSSTYVTLDLPTSDFGIGLVQAGLKSEGKPPATVVKIPSKPGDYSPQAAQIAATKSQCVIMGLGTSQGLALYPALTNAGSTQRIVGYEGNSVSPELVSKLPKQMEGALNLDFFPAYSGSKWDAYRTLTAKYSDPKKYDFSVAGAQLAYLSVLVFQKAVQAVLDAKLDVTAANLITTLDKTTHLDIGPLLPPLNFSTPAPIKGFGRMFLRDVTFETVKDGKIVSLDNDTFHDMTSVLQAQLGTA
ncbi:MAG: ABC transporter substrate-binding protein [Actinobacteria bacterium]|nr:ABC transporter substrate-binding protein [Actinomycetota bacterium]